MIDADTSTDMNPDDFENLMKWRKAEQGEPSCATCGLAKIEGKYSKKYRCFHMIGKSRVEFRTFRNETCSFHEERR